MENNVSIDINLDHLMHNVDSLINLYPGYKYYFGLITGNAYGHGLEVAKSLVKAGINYLVTSNITDARAVRKMVKTPILTLGQVTEETINLAIKNNITLTVSSLADIKKILNINARREVKIHLLLALNYKQIGIESNQELLKIIDLIRDAKINFEGIMANISSDNEEVFNKEISILMNIINGVDAKIVHVYSSKMVVKYPKLKIANAVRFGIIMYGINPTAEIIKADLREALSVNTHIINFKELPYDEAELTRTLPNLTKVVGIIPVGYQMGILRNNVGRNITVNFKRFKIAAVDMLNSYVEVDEDTNIGDKVTLYGGLISLRDASNYLGISIYEFIFNINSEITRHYYENNIERR